MRLGALVLCSVMMLTPACASVRNDDVSGRWTFASEWSNSDYRFTTNGTAAFMQVDGARTAELVVTDVTYSQFSGAGLRGVTEAKTCTVSESDAGIALACYHKGDDDRLIVDRYALQREGGKLVGTLNEHSVTFERAP